MIEFFFYYNLKNESLIQEINNHNNNYNIMNSYIYVNNYDNLNNLIIHTENNENKLKLSGKYVQFWNQSFDDILQKINQLNIGDENKKYKIIQQNCYLTENDEKKFVYLII